MIFVALLFNACAIPAMHAAAEPKELETMKGRLDKAWQRFKRCITKRECSKGDVAAITGAIVVLIILVGGGGFLFGTVGGKRMMRTLRGKLSVHDTALGFLEAFIPFVKEHEVEAKNKIKEAIELKKQGKPPGMHLYVKIGGDQPTDEFVNLQFNQHLKKLQEHLEFVRLGGYSFPYPRLVTNGINPYLSQELKEEFWKKLTERLKGEYMYGAPVGWDYDAWYEKYRR